MSKTIVITGANRGLGLEFARQYVADGWRVHAACRAPEQATELARLAQDHAGTLSVHPLDVTNAAQISALAASLGSTPVDVLLNNAGIYGQKGGAFGETDPEAWVRTFRVNTIAPMKIMEALVDRVAASPAGVMAVVSSKMGSLADNGSGGSYVYRSSKSAVNSVVKSASIDLADRGVAVVALHPGWVQTDMGGSSAPLAIPDSVAQLRAVIDSVDMSRTGQFIDRDGSVIPW